jgi:hypothetical protein
MNIIVTNKYKDLIYNTNIEVLKDLNGVFKVSEIVNNFQSVFYKKIIIDATALDGFPKDTVLKELASRFDVDKLILFLPPDNPPPKSFLSFLVSLNIYNFTDNPRGLVELVKRSNTYNDVAEYARQVEDKIDNSKNDIDYTNFNDTSGRVILGLKNITDGNSSTTLSYLLKKTLEDVYKKQVLAVEVDKNDFRFYNSNNLYSVSKNSLKDFLKEKFNTEVIIIDLDGKSNTDMCSDIIYLVDPSLYKINKLMFEDRTVFSNLKGKKVVLVNSLLSENDINLFAKEAGISVYFSIPPLNDRRDNPILNNLLIKLGIVEEIEKPKRGLFDIFK